MMGRIITAFVLLTIASSVMAENKADCPSSITLNGMKMELTLSAPIIVSKATNGLIKKSVIVLTFTAQDRDILWQRELYSHGTHISANNLPKPSYDLQRVESLPYMGLEISEPEVLKKGSASQFEGNFYNVDFAKLGQKNINTITVKAKIGPRELDSFYRSPTMGNHFVGDKNVWQEKTTLCLTANWQYGKLPVEQTAEPRTPWGAFFKALMQ